jgi:hypothetical protein
VSGDAGFTKRLLCVAEAINQAALFEKEEVSRLNKRLLF